MNLATSEPSLFQLTQDLDEPLTPLSVGTETLKSYISSIIELLIDEQISATVWLKLPQTNSWVSHIRKLQQEGNTKQILVCNTQKSQPSMLVNEATAKTETKFLKLKSNPTLQRESFLIVSSPNFCALVLAQWQKSKIQIDASGKRLQQPYLEMVSSFADRSIIPVIKAIEENIAANRTKAELDFNIAPHAAVDSEFLSNLLLKQLYRQEKVQAALNLTSKSDRTPEPSSLLGLQEDFLDNLVQELRAPITHMKTALSLLESKQIKGEQRQRYLQMVSDQCDRQNSLVSGLLGLLQLDTPIESDYLRLDDVVPGIVSTYQPLAEEREILLGYTIPANLPPISCPNNWFRQIIINLLNNSLQFTTAKGRVFVQAFPRNNNEQVEISVTDTGVGIPSKEITKIFDGFYRTKPTNEGTVLGAGLGLTLVKQLVDRCGGTISVKSKPGKGTTFKILMPAVPAELVN